MILLTGSNGFLGSALNAEAVKRDIPVRAAVRSAGKTDIVTAHEVGDIGSNTAWKTALEGIDTVIHTAARVHVMSDKASDPLAMFRMVNVAGTLNLARQAVSNGVKRFVFVSSIKVNGELTFPGQIFKPDDTFIPQDPYGLSKYEAEMGLRALASETGLEVVIVRPVLVHGPGVKANFAAMLRWLNSGKPLPLGAVVGNQRSLLGLDNLVDLLYLCATHPAAANQTFLASDGEDVSTADLLHRIGRALGRPANLLHVPVGILKVGAAVLGKADFAQRLLGNLQVDITKNHQLLDWTPPVSLDEGLRRAVVNFK